MKARIVSLGVTDDQTRGVIGVRLSGNNSDTRFTFLVSVEMATMMSKGTWLGAEVDFDVTMTLGDQKATIT